MRFEFISLLLLRSTSAVCNIPQATFVLTIGKDLLTAQVLLLLGPHTISILLILFSHLSLPHLHTTLVHHGSCLLGVETLEMVRLDAMWRQHRLLCCRVLCHEVVSIGRVHICGCLKLLVGTLSSVSVSLLFSCLGVGILDSFFHGRASGLVLVLRLFQ